jgi:hypothetical protein
MIGNNLLLKKLYFCSSFFLKHIMNLKSLKTRIERINLHPATEWDVIKNEPGCLWHLKKVAIPMTLTAALAVFAGNLFIMKIYDYPFAYVLVKSVVSFVVSFFSMFVSSLIINELNEHFSLEKNIHKSLKLFIYSFTAFWLASTIAGIMADYKTLGKFIKFLGLYGAYPYWIGVSKVLGINGDKKTKYVLVSLLTVVVVYTLLSWSLNFVVKGVYYTNLGHS